MNKKTGVAGIKGISSTLGAIVNHAPTPIFLNKNIKEVHTNKEFIKAVKEAKKGDTIFFNEYSPTPSLPMENDKSV